MKDYYEILGLEQDADAQAIKKAYRKLAMKWHPDRNSGNKDAEERFKEINEAYETLGDATKKSSYDRQFSSAGSSNEQAQGFEDVDEMMHNFFGQNASPFADIFGFSRTSRIIAHGEVSISFWEAVFGCEKNFELSFRQNGQQVYRSIKVTLPAGCSDGDSFLVSLDNHQLSLQVQVLPDEHFQRDNLDLYTSVEVPFTMATLGGQIAFPHWTGQMAVNIPPGIQAGQKIRIANAGIKKNMFCGDLYLSCQITVPKKITKKQRELLEQFSKTEQEKEQGWFESIKALWKQYTH